jgi:hypothetical protein
MSFDQIPQADFWRDSKIVGTNVESLGKRDAHTNQNETAERTA